MYNFKNTKVTRQKLFYLSTFLLAIVSIYALLRYCMPANQSADEQSYFEYTEEDVEMLGNFMQAEMMYATNVCSLENVNAEDLKYTYMLVGSVVLHRLESGMWGETMRQVIFVPGQYQYLISMKMDFMVDVDTSPEVYEWAEELLKYGPKGPEGLVYEFWFENKPFGEPYWELGGMHFYVDKFFTKQVEGGKVN